LFLGSGDSMAGLSAVVRRFSQHSKRFFRRRDLILNLPTSCDVGSFQCIHTIGDLRIYPDSEIEPERNYFIGHTHHQFHIHCNGQHLA
jgi:hypothetical protein